MQKINCITIVCTDWPLQMKEPMLIYAVCLVSHYVEEGQCIKSFKYSTRALRSHQLRKSDHCEWQFCRSKHIVVERGHRRMGRLTERQR